jgi:mediator of RNA polymerase II transcription subunit 10
MPSSAHLHDSLTAIHASASSTSAPDIQIPPELIEYVDAGRNPDIYTREFVELVRRQNQILKGKKHAFTSFRDILALEMASGLPEIRSNVEEVIRQTGGDVKKVLGALPPQEKEAQ